MPTLTNKSRDFVERPRPSVHSGVVDLSQVNERLRAAPAETDVFARSPSIATTEPLPSEEEQDLEDLRQEIAAYTELVDVGGRPPYPRHLLEEFFWTPERFLDDDRYRDIVLFWRFHNTDRSSFCQCHLLRWMRFRSLQHIIRSHAVRDEHTLITASSFETLDKFVNHPASREWLGHWDFYKYSKNIKARLIKYDFARPFHLEEDLEQQDELTTWIEYLGYEYFFYNQAANYIKCFQKRHDDAWRRLVDSNLLRPEETYDVIYDLETPFRYERERQQAEMAVHSAKLTAFSAPNAKFTPRRATHSHGNAPSQQAEALAKLTQAEANLRLTDARGDAIGAFLQTIREYRCQKVEVERHSLLLRWIEQQIPSIERESNLRKTGSDVPACKDNKKSLKRVRPRDLDEVQTSAGRSLRETSGRAFKQLKTCNQEDLTTIVSPGASVQASATVTASTTTVPSLGNSTTPVMEPLRLRRSARVAERMNKTAVSAERALSSVRAPSRIQPPASRAKRKRRKRNVKVASLKKA